MLHDLCSLENMDIEDILRYLKKRYNRGETHVYAGPMLITLNPYATNNTLDDNNYINNLFKIILDSKEIYKNQIVIISGESGSGKTVNTKIGIEYLLKNNIEDNKNIIDFNKITKDNINNNIDNINNNKDIDNIDNKDSGSNNNIDSINNKDNSKYGNNKDSINNNNTYTYNINNNKDIDNKDSGSNINNKNNNNNNNINTPYTTYTNNKNNNNTTYTNINNTYNTYNNINKYISNIHPILEAFGNSRTALNDNSSRFGKLIKIYYKQRSIVGMKIKTYLLEKSRVSQQNRNEYNYHIFYYVAEYYGIDINNNRFISSISNYKDYNAPNPPNPSNILRNNYKEVELALSTLNIDKDYVFSVIKCILYLGNINIIDKDGRYNIISDDIEYISSITNMDINTFKEYLLLERLNINREEIIKYNDKKKIKDKIDMLGRRLYCDIFKYIIDRINYMLVVEDVDVSTISLVDIYGFEDNGNNDIEQFCINWANEKIQSEFIKDLFEVQINKYIEEGISIENIESGYNRSALSLIEDKYGIVDLVNEECMLNGNISNLILKINNYNKDNRALRVRGNFISVKHYAGDIEYGMHNFIVKNKDNGKAVMGRDTVLSTFKESLSSLFSIIHNSKVYYIRCIKPNAVKKQLFVDEEVERQLISNGIIQTIEISKNGYFYDVDKKIFYERYSECILYKAGNMVGDYNNILCNILYNNINNIYDVLNDILLNNPNMLDIKIGKTKIFLKNHTLCELEDIKLQIENSKYIIYKYCRIMIDRKNNIEKIIYKNIIIRYIMRMRNMRVVNRFIRIMMDRRENCRAVIKRELKVLLDRREKSRYINRYFRIIMDRNIKDRTHSKTYGDHHSFYHKTNQIDINTLLIDPLSNKSKAELAAMVDIIKRELSEIEVNENNKDKIEYLESKIKQIELYLNGGEILGRDECIKDRNMEKSVDDKQLTNQTVNRVIDESANQMSGTVSQSNHNKLNKCTNCHKVEIKYKYQTEELKKIKEKKEDTPQNTEIEELRKKVKELEIKLNKKSHPLSSHYDIFSCLIELYLNDYNYNKNIPRDEILSLSHIAYTIIIKLRENRREKELINIFIAQIEGRIIKIEEKIDKIVFLLVNIIELKSIINHRRDGKSQEEKEAEYSYDLSMYYSDYNRIDRNTPIMDSNINNLTLEEINEILFKIDNLISVLFVMLTRKILSSIYKLLPGAMIEYDGFNRSIFNIFTYSVNDMVERIEDIYKIIKKYYMPVEYKYEIFNYILRYINYSAFNRILDRKINLTLEFSKKLNYNINKIEDMLRRVKYVEGSECMLHLKDVVLLINYIYSMDKNDNIILTLEDKLILNSRQINALVENIKDTRVVNEYKVIEEMELMLSKPRVDVPEYNEVRTVVNMVIPRFIPRKSIMSLFSYIE